MSITFDDATAQTRRMVGKRLAFETPESQVKRCLDEAAGTFPHPYLVVPGPVLGVYWPRIEGDQWVSTMDVIIESYRPDHGTPRMLVVVSINHESTEEGLIDKLRTCLTQPVAVADGPNWIVPRGDGEPCR